MASRDTKGVVNDFTPAEWEKFSEFLHAAKPGNSDWKDSLTEASNAPKLNEQHPYITITKDFQRRVLGRMIIQMYQSYRLVEDDWQRARDAEFNYLSNEERKDFQVDAKGEARVKQRIELMAFDKIERASHDELNEHMNTIAAEFSRVGQVLRAIRKAVEESEDNKNKAALARTTEAESKSFLG